MIVSPTRQITRAMYMASVLGVLSALFISVEIIHKSSTTQPIIAHEFLGDSVEGMDILIVDDMISSGDSILDIATEMKNRGARNIYCAVTFGLFTEGIDHFQDAYEKGIISKVFATNLIYRRPELINAPWFYDVNLTKFVALLIDAINHDASCPISLTRPKNPETPERTQQSVIIFLRRRVQWKFYPRF